MDTSKNYYETVMKDYAMYSRGRTLEQYCRDEAVDYRWLTKAQTQYGNPEKSTKAKVSRHSKASAPDMIQLHFEHEDQAGGVTGKEPGTSAVMSNEEGSTNSIKGGWSVMSLSVKTPSGHEIEIITDNPSAVSELLAKLIA